MTWILHIETATSLCGVALSKNGECIATKSNQEGLNHAEKLHVFIEDILKEQQLKPSDLSAISVSAGPGSYTGLRIGLSAAKGLTYALNIPLLTLSTLQILAAVVKVKYDFNENVILCPMLDARRMEIYTALFNEKLELLKEPSAEIVDENWVKLFPKESPIYFFGDGMNKCNTLLSSLPNALFCEDIFPLPQFACKLGYNKYLSKKFADVAYSEPEYLKPYFFAKG
jgi:tRNA threonylcarbamoyladenosine biosynthesis protein TsaB